MATDNTKAKIFNESLDLKQSPSDTHDPNKLNNASLDSITNKVASGKMNKNIKKTLK